MSTSPQLQEALPGLWTCDIAATGVEARACLLYGENHALVWDSLTRPSDMAALNEALAGKPCYLVYSHADWDHIWGTAGLLREPLSIVAHSECLRRFDDDVPRTLRRKQEEAVGIWDAVQLAPPNLTFETRLSLDLGGVTLELHHLPGHTPDCIVGWIPQWGVLLGGDAIETPLPIVNSARLLTEWLATLESWAGRADLQYAIPSHGKASGRESLEATIAYLRALVGNRNFNLPAQLDDFYRETHQKNLIVVDGGLELLE